jgi:O-methyltransferase
MSPLEYAEKICYSSRKTLQHTFKIAQQFNKPGAIFFECGVAAGAQVIAMLYGAPHARVYACDSFEGIPLPSNRDDQMPGIRKLTEEEQKALPNPGEQELISSGATSVSDKDFKNHIFESGVQCWGPAGYRFHIVKGWFEKTLYNSEFLDDIDISVLRLDGDLYNSTWVCLQHLFPKVVEGGCVIIDDYGLKGCREACGEYFNLIGYEPKYIHEPVTHFFK